MRVQRQSILALAILGLVSYTEQAELYLPKFNEINEVELDVDDIFWDAPLKKIEKPNTSYDTVLNFLTNQAVKTEPEIQQERKPFTSVKLLPYELVGTVLMYILIALSNMGGLSGAGSNIPIMLIFYDQTMEEAVPLSAFVAVCGTLLRFILNFRQKHPYDKNRCAINYEVVEVTMPFVFLGAFIGVKTGKIIGEIPRVIIFGVTVAWSIQTSAKKALQLIEKEKKEAIKEQEALLNPDNQEPTNTTAAETANADTEAKDKIDDADYLNIPELQGIFNEEKYHFTSKRVLFVFINFCLLMINSVCDKGLKSVPLKISVNVAFGLCMIALTYQQSKKISKVHEDKATYGYKFAKNDLQFETTGKIVKLAIFCCIAAMLCGMTGIAGGMVLGPLFLRYNMVPQVMSGTNQYITLIASLATAIQFIYVGDILWGYAILYGAITILAAFTGLKAINIYLARSGKQSVITILLTFVLIVALLSLPLKYLIKKE